MIAGLLSVVAAAFYTLGLGLQQQAATGAPTGAGGWFTTARRIVLRPLWVGGFALTAVGFGLHGTALSLGSLTTVQILQTSQIVFAVPLGARLAGVPVQRRDWAGAAMVAAGLVLLLVALRPSEDTGDGSRDGWAATVVIGTLIVAAIVALAHVRPGSRAPLLGAAAGFLFGVEGATLKIASDDLAAGLSVATLLAPAVGATFLLALGGVTLQNLALRAGRLSVALSTMTIAMPLTSTVIGVVVFGEDLELSVVTVALSAVAVGLAATGVVLLAQASDRADQVPAVRARSAST